MNDFLDYVDRYRSSYPIETATRFAFCLAMTDGLRDISERLAKIEKAISGQEGDLK